MDIHVSSNFERLLFELLDRDAAACARIMTGFRQDGRMVVPDAAWSAATGLFRGLAVDDTQTMAEIRRLRDEAGYVADPHTAIGIAAGRAWAVPGMPTVAMATAHPAKFPDAMRAALGTAPALPPRLADLYERPERYRVVANRLDAVAEAMMG